MAHRIDGRKLGRKTGPRKALYKNLIVAVLRYEQIKTTEARAKEVRGHGRAASSRSPRTARSPRAGGSSPQLPDEPLVIDKLIERDRAQVRGPQLGLHPGRQARPAGRRRGAHRPARAGLATRPAAHAAQPDAPSEARPRGRPRAVQRTGRIRRHRVRRLPGPAWRRTVQGELERRSPASTAGAGSGSTAAGRTDAGVHATGQVIAFTWPGRLPGGRARSGARGAAAAGRRDRAAAAGGRGLPAPPTRRCGGSTATRIWNGPRSPLRERYALGLREPLDVEAMAGRGRGAGRTARLLRLRRTGIDNRPDPPRGPGPQDGSHWSRSRWSGTRSCARWFAASWPRSSASGAARRPRRTWRPRCARRDRAFAGAIAPPHGLCLRRVTLGRPDTRQDEGTTRTMSRTYTPTGERDRAPLVRRRRRRPDARPACLARGARCSTGKHKPTYATHIDTGDHVIVLNAAQDRRHRRQARGEDLRAPQRLPGRLPRGDARPPARAAARGGHPPRRQGHAAAQQAGRAAAAQAQGLRGHRPSRTRRSSRSRCRRQEAPRSMNHVSVLLRHRPAQDQHRPRPAARRRGRGRGQRPHPRGALRQRRRPGRHHDALPGDRHRGPLQRDDQGRGRRPPRPGRRHPPRHRPGAARSPTPRARALRCARPAS